MSDKKRFSINVESMIEDKKEVFTFSGPGKAPLGLIYDASHRVLVEVAAIIKKHADETLKKNKDGNAPTVQVSEKDTEASSEKK